MKNHEGCKRGFHWSTKAWYNDKNQNLNSVTFGMYASEGGTTGEMSIEWIELNGRQVPKLEVFDDAWSALSLFRDLIDELGKVDNETISQENFVQILKKCGFEDLTAYDNPYKLNDKAKLKQELTRLKKQERTIIDRLGELES